MVEGCFSLSKNQFLLLYVLKPMLFFQNGSSFEMFAETPSPTAMGRDHLRRHWWSSMMRFDLPSY